jgi:hypothetical protein
MDSLPVLGFLEWWQWIAVVVLIALIIVYMQLKKRSM